MNYVLGKQRAQLQIECLNDYVDDNSEVRVIDKQAQTAYMSELRWLSPLEICKHLVQPEEQVLIFVLT